MRAQQLEKADAVDRAGGPADARRRAASQAEPAPEDLVAGLLVEHLPLRAALGNRPRVGAESVRRTSWSIDSSSFDLVLEDAKHLGAELPRTSLVLEPLTTTPSVAQRSATMRSASAKRRSRLIRITGEPPLLGELALHQGEDPLVVGGRVADLLGVVHQEGAGVGVDLLFGVQVLDEDSADHLSAPALVPDLDELARRPGASPPPRHASRQPRPVSPCAASGYTAPAGGCQGRCGRNIGKRRLSAIGGAGRQNHTEAGPLSGLALTSVRPPWASTSARTRLRPSPSPGWWRSRDRRLRTYLSKIARQILGRDPDSLVLHPTRASSLRRPPTRRRSAPSPPLGEYFTALDRRFFTIRSSASGSRARSGGVVPSGSSGTVPAGARRRRARRCRSTSAARSTALAPEHGGDRPRCARGRAARVTMRPRRRASVWMWPRKRAACSGATAPRQQQLAEALERGERGPQLVRDDREELGLGMVQLARRAVAAATLSSSSAANRRWRRVRRAFSMTRARCMRHLGGGKLARRTGLPSTRPRAPRGRHGRAQGQHEAGDRRRLRRTHRERGRPADVPGEHRGARPSVHRAAA